MNSANRIRWVFLGIVLAVVAGATFMLLTKGADEAGVSGSADSSADILVVLCIELCSKWLKTNYIDGIIRVFIPCEESLGLDY